MGYESRFYVVEKTQENNYCTDCKKTWAKVLSIHNLGKLGRQSKILDILRESKNTQNYIYEMDGINIILADDYGEELKEITIENLLIAIEEDVEYYFGEELDIFADYLVSLKKLPYYKKLAILHYGY